MPETAPLLGSANGVTDKEEAAPRVEDRKITSAAGSIIKVIRLKTSATQSKEMASAIRLGKLFSR